ncbi:hypothetical protein [Salinarimonas soli]|uniref:Uncharacterized protein n=1 Tax=Salinarimonas soli TaxID=1638099 RepID=A0A5B2VF32_9HYPH|nr:hypothetical protein [Salinarimonas soli]KAA2236919.1 hypothetical protein F0L46_13090 [Salinarimonas soli]
MIDSFLIRPSGLLERYPKGDQALSYDIRDLVSGDIKTLDPVMRLLNSANGLQRRAIGVGIGAAARMCLTASEAALARRLQDTVRRHSDAELNTGFTAAVSDRGSSPTLLEKPMVPEPSNSLGRGSIADPQISPFRPESIPDPFAPRR